MIESTQIFISEGGKNLVTKQLDDESFSFSPLAWVWKFFISDLMIDDNKWYNCWLEVIKKR